MEAIDALVLAKLAASHTRVDARSLARSVSMSSSELANSLLRLRAAGLFSHLGIDPERALDFFEHALKYMIPPRKRREMARGTPTGSHVAPLNELFVPSATPWVWPSDEGDVIGRPLEPIDPSVVQFVRGDDSLYLVLACADCFRVGDARERNAARRVLGALVRRNALGQRQQSA